jgi:hypothetical protein
MQTESMQRAAHFASIAASILAVFAFGVGLWQFTVTQKQARETLELQTDTLKHERQSKAIDYFIKFNELQKDAAGKPLPKNDDDPEFWRHNLLLALTEQLFLLTEGDMGWELTVQWMLEKQEPFLVGKPQGCNTFAVRFVALMRKAAPAMKCAKQA